MPRNIVLFSDGTGNSAGKLFKTNVWRLYQALDLSGPQQIAYYDDGVGTSSFKPYAILGGALGLGLKRNVKHLYAYLSRNYQAGDRIYGFGFSRGAFTMRVLVGLVHDQGLAKGETGEKRWQDVEAKWRAYRKKARTRTLGKIRSMLFGKPARGQSKPDPEVEFTFLGLWDTVSAYGLPVDELTRAWDHYVWPLSLQDRVASSRIKKAFHALCIDDERNTFHPVLWTEEAEVVNSTSTTLDQERISQVWFAGMHANVGGGYPDDSLSSVSLDWIMSEAARRGLVFANGELARVRAAATPNGKMYDSRRGLAGYYRYNPRKIAKLVADDFHQVSVARPKIHESVFNRIVSGDDRYAPITLPEDYAVVKADGSIAGRLESPAQARVRAEAQERVWNWVWAKRIVYFATLAPSIWLALFPLLFKQGLDGVCASKYFCFLSPVIGVAAWVLPGFAGSWINSFEANPGWFLLGVGAIAALLFQSEWLGGTIKDTMRLLWSQALGSRLSTVERSGWWWRLYRVRSSKVYQGLFHGLTRYVLPGLFALGIYYSGFVLLSRAEFSVLSATGWGRVCTETASPKRIDGHAVSFPFDTRSPCLASGYSLEEGAQYRIWIDIDSEWRDGERIKTDVQGFGSEKMKMSLPMYVAVPFRRWLSERWFKPIARIDAHGNDEYPLHLSAPFATNGTMSTPVTTLRARRSGELFLYVNDAVFFWPWWHTYGNNKGSATVKIQRVASPPMP